MEENININNKLLEMIAQEINRNPCVRFGQALQMLGIVPAVNVAEFYHEPSIETIKRAKRVKGGKK
jgi:hypothetical protein